MKSKLALIFAGATLAIASSTVPAKALPPRFIEIKGEAPQAGNLVSYNEALRHEKELCSILGQWDIARLANGASMDGRGYGCKIRPDDSRTLGNAILSIKVPHTPPLMDSKLRNN